MNRSWLGVLAIVVILTGFVVGDSACSKKDEPAETVHFDPLGTPSPSGSPNQQATKDTPEKKKRKIVFSNTKEFIIQVGSFSKKENADRLAARLKERNYKVNVVESDHKTLGKLYLVRLDPMKDLELTRSTIDKLQAQENLKPVIIGR